MMLPKHFSFATDAIGLKTNGKDDVLAIFCDVGAITSAVFTQNTCPGAPVVVSKQHLAQTPLVQAILINAGVANVATGIQGQKDAEESAKLLAQALSCPVESVLVSSTGKIGDFLPMDTFAKTIPNLPNKRHTNIQKAAEAIMTTDLTEKIASAKVGNTTIVGIAKGSGMIAPNMATMLAFIMTDAKVDQKTLNAQWKQITQNTFNMVSVDNCESTSDMALVLSSNEYEVDSQLFYTALEQVARSLAIQIARDGEGATVLIECVVSAESKDEAQKMAKAVISSDLLKTAIHGKDPNWGRIMQAIGSTHIAFDSTKTQISIDGQAVFLQGEPQTFDPKKMFQKDTVSIQVSIGSASHTATAWGCDLSNEYITINALYHT